MPIFVRREKSGTFWPAVAPKPKINDNGFSTELYGASKKSVVVARMWHILDIPWMGLLFNVCLAVDQGHRNRQWLIPNVWKGGLALPCFWATDDMKKGKAEGLPQ